MKTLLLFIAIFYCFLCKGQTADSFHLSGIIDKDTGTVVLYSGGYVGDYPQILNFRPVQVSKGRFIFQEQLSQPIYVFLKFTSGDQTYLTDRFYLCPVQQYVECHMDSLREKVGIQNAAMSEYNNSYLTKEYLSIDTVSDYNRLRTLRKFYLYQYALKNPDSFVALWQISSNLSYGYNKWVDSAFNVLSDKIKNTESGKLIRNDLNQLSLLDTGKIFPDLVLIDMQGNHKKISFKKTGSKYTLIDFWFAHCGACLSEFPTFSELYKTYKGKGFSIVGVSNDASPANIKAWKHIIETKPLRWTQYRTNEKTFNDLRIQYCPSNFLVDSTGKIVAVNLEYPEVVRFIKKNLVWEPALRLTHKD